MASWSTSVVSEDHTCEKVISMLKTLIKRIIIYIYLWLSGGCVGQLGAGSPTSLDSPVFNTLIFSIVIGTWRPSNDFYVNLLARVIQATWGII